MACLKLGSKTDAFQRKGQAWFYTTGLPSDVIVEVGDVSFHLHKIGCAYTKFILSRSVELMKLLFDFYLDLVEDNRRIIPRDYLEVALRPVQGSKRDVAAKNEKLNHMAELDQTCNFVKGD